MSKATEEVIGGPMPRLVREAGERRLAAIAAENKRKMEQARRTPSVPLNACTCGRPAILVPSINLGKYEVHCEGYWDAEGWSCPEGRCTDDHAEARDAEEEWNSGRATIFGLANVKRMHHYQRRRASITGLVL